MCVKYLNGRHIGGAGPCAHRARPRSGDLANAVITDVVPQNARQSTSIVFARPTYCCHFSTAWHRANDSTFFRLAFTIALSQHFAVGRPFAGIWPDGKRRFSALNARTVSDNRSRIDGNRHKSKYTYFRSFEEKKNNIVGIMGTK